MLDHEDCPAPRPYNGHYCITGEDRRPSSYALRKGVVVLCEGTSIYGAAKALRVDLHFSTATESKLVFVHAAVVCLNGLAYLFPGPSMSGKSTLAQAFFSLGKTVYSDEYAVLGHNGVLQAFPRPIQLRFPHPDQTDLPTDPALYPRLRVGGIFCLAHDAKHSGLALKGLSLSQAILLLFENTVAAKGLGSKAISSIARALKEAQLWEGVRGDALPAAQQICELVEVRG